MNQFQQQRQQMGWAWQKKKEKLRQEREEFNRRQFEAEQRILDAKAAESEKDRLFGGEAWKSDAVRTYGPVSKEPGRTFVQTKKVKGKIEGEARGVEHRMEQHGNRNMEKLSFRLERYNEAGDRLQPLPVQMLGGYFQGTIQEGDWVRVSGNWKAGKMMKLSQVYNITTNSKVEAKRRSSYMWIANLIWLALIVGLIALFIKH